MLKYRILDHSTGEFVMNCSSRKDAESKVSSLNYKADLHDEDHDYDIDYCDDGLTYLEWCERCDD